MLFRRNKTPCFLLVLLSPLHIFVTFFFLASRSFELKVTKEFENEV